jgi:hypothetical protein
MGMRIAGAHHCASILENLDMVDGFDGAELAELSDPCMHDRFDFFRGHGCERQIVARRKADDSAYTRLSLRYNQSSPLKVDAVSWSLWLQGGEVILEDKSQIIRRIVNAAGSNVARA